MISRATALCASVLVAILMGAPHPARAAQPFQPWTKHGVIIRPGFAGSRSILRVSAPSVVKLKHGRLRLYFWAMGFPDAKHAANDQPYHYIFAAEASVADPYHWRLVKQEPMLGPAPSGDIRDRGPSFPWVLPRRNEPWLMYYGAWGSWAPQGELSNRTGLAISRDQGMTWKVLKEAVLPLGLPGSDDAALTGSVDVMRLAPHRYMMWYTAGERYQKIGDTNRLIVNVGMARSTDGVHWVKYRKPALRPRLNTGSQWETVVSKPSVLLIDGVYHMWFSLFDMENKGYRGATAYRLAYARSTDGVTWHRYPEEILPLTPGGFDSANQSYPCVIDMGKQLWMFYTGNSFGSTGIGLATLDKSQLRKEHR